KGVKGPRAAKTDSGFWTMRFFSKPARDSYHAFPGMHRILFVPAGRSVGKGSRACEPCPGRAVAGPMGGVGQDLQDIRPLVNRIGFVARTEVENPPQSPFERAAAAEYVAPLVPRQEYHLVGLGDVVALAVHFMLVQ